MLTPELNPQDAQNSRLGILRWNILEIGTGRA
jgi:hypothetical protein